METREAAMAGEMEVEAFRRLYPLKFYERYLNEGVRPDARPLGRARATSVVLGAVPSADGSAMAKIGHTAMLAAVKLEVMTPTAEAPDEGRIAIDFQMPPICSPYVRPGRPAEVAPVISEQLSKAFARCHQLKGTINIKWQSSLDGILVQIPVVSVTEEGKVIPACVDAAQADRSVTKGKSEGERNQQLTLGKIPFALTCILYKKHLLADPTAEEEAILQTIITVVLDPSGRLISFYKPGGYVLASTSTVQDCIALTRHRVRELQRILNRALSEMEDT